MVNLITFITLIPLFTSPVTPTPAHHKTQKCATRHYGKTYSTNRQPPFCSEPKVPATSYYPLLTLLLQFLLLIQPNFTAPTLTIPTTTNPATPHIIFYPSHLSYSCFTYTSPTLLTPPYSSRLLLLLATTYSPLPPFLCIRCAFQDAQNLYLVLDYVGGGDMYALIQDR